jgi:hypothetical protein
MDFLFSNNGIKDGMVAAFSANHTKGRNRQHLM